MPEPFEISDDFIARQNRRDMPELEAAFGFLGGRLSGRGVDIEALVRKAQSLKLGLPSWGVGTGGTRFARFPGPGEPRDAFEKIDDCGTIQRLCRVTPSVSLHIPWDAPDDPAALRRHAERRGIGFDAMNSNTFQDQKDQKLSYKFGSLTHPDAEVRKQAIAHNIDCIKLGQELGSKALTVWIGDGVDHNGVFHPRIFEQATAPWVNALMDEPDTAL